MYTLRLFFLLIIKVVYVTSVIRPLPAWIQVDDTTCLRVQGASIRNAFSQMVDIAEAAYSRTTMARVPGGPQPATDVVINTLSTYFAPSGLRHAQDRVTNLIGYLNDIKNLASNPMATITISCGDSYLTKSRVGEFGANLPGNMYQLVDTRFVPNVWFPLGELGCGDPQTGAYSDAPYNYIVLCPTAFALYPTLSKVQVNEDISVTDRDTYIDQVRPLGTALFHEFLHILHDNSMTGGNNEAYGFRDCWRLAFRNTAATITMPDCIALYAYSLYLEGNDWSSGKPRQL